MYLVVGATGNLGSEVCKMLRSNAKPVRALVRLSSDPNKVQNLRILGVETVVGDLRNIATLPQACLGVTAIISTASSLRSHWQGDNFTTVDLEGHKALIDTAKRTGVSRFVYISLSGHHTTDCPLTNAKREIEQYLKNSGLTYTIVRPSALMEQWLSPVSGFDITHGKATIFGTGQSKISFISVKDVAQFISVSLDSPHSKNSTIELGGPKPLSYLEAVDLFQNITGRKFSVQKITPEFLLSQKNQSKDPFSQSTISYSLDLAQGDEIDMRETLNNYLMKLTTVQDYAKQLLSK